MKRSEMHVKIQSYIEQKFNPFNSKVHANMILDIIEKAGMLPPYHNPWTGPSCLCGFNESCRYCSSNLSEQILDKCKWEPEDEESPTREES